jgi:phenylacetate-CoA ligase
MPSRRIRALYDRLPVPLQEVVVSTAGWRSYRHRFGPDFHRILRELEASDLADRDAVVADQERRLQEMVRWAAETVPWYREMFRSEGIDPDSIRTLDDLVRIPPLDKETVRTRARELCSDAIPARTLIQGHSSGTTGTALSLAYTREAMAWEYAVNFRQRGWFGVRLGDRYAAFGGQTVVPLTQSAPPFWRYDRPRHRMLFSLYHMTPANLEHYIRELSRPGYRFWQGYPSSLSLVAGWINEHDFELGAATPAAVFTSSESLLAFQRDEIARAVRAPIADRYGHSEFAVSALTCPEGRYHVDTEFCVVEIDGREETPEGSRGEILATGFANRAMPLLRYRTGDIATLRSDAAACSCGRSRPILERIDGRMEDYVVTPDGRRIGRMDHVFKDALAVREAQIVQPSIDRIVIRLVPRPEFDEASRRALAREIRDRLGDGMALEFELIDAIPRLPNGKFRAVVSEIAGGSLRSAPRAQSPPAI